MYNISVQGSAKSQENAPNLPIFIQPAPWILCTTLCFFFIRTSNFGAEAERSYIFLRFEAENVFKMFLTYMVYTTCISVNQALPAEIWYQELLIMTNRDVCHHC